MIKRILCMWKNGKEIIMYLIFGVLTTLVNYAVYFTLVNAAGVNYLLSNAAAWLASVVFAFITNKLYVFNAKQGGFLELLREALLFTSARILSGVFETAALYVFADRLAFNNGIVKVSASVVVVIANYILSKLLIFKKKTGGLT